MRELKKSNPTLIEIIRYWKDQEKKNIGKFNMELYLKICHAKAYNVRYDSETNKYYRI